MNQVLAAEAELLWAVFRDHYLVDRLIGACGGWRTLSAAELSRLDLTDTERKAVTALQELVQRGYPVLTPLTLATPSEVGEIYTKRLGGWIQEVMFAIALDGKHRVIEEIMVATGSSQAIALTAGDVLRPLIRAGARGFVLVHNHPSGDPSPSAEDLHFTHALAAAATIVGITFVDHVIVGGRGGGFTSLFEQGHIDVAA